MKIKKMVIITTICAALGAFGVTVSAAENEPQENSTVTAETAVAEESTKSETKIPDNPFTDGMLSDDDLYEYIADYINTGETLDLEGSGVLIDEDILNPDKTETKTDENNEKTTDAAQSKEKVMYTVATRDGSTFYIIIDKSSGGENVYFLNKVDLVDLASLIGTDKDEDKLSEQEKEIIASASGITVKPVDNTSSGNGNNGDVIPDNPQSSKPDQDTSSNNGTKPSPGNSYIIYIVIGAVVVVAIIIGWYFKIGPGKKKKTTFEEDDYEDEEETPKLEEYINEDAIEDEDENE